MDTLDLHFPFAGLDVSKAFCKQPNRSAVKGKYARTTPIAYNVRAFDSQNRDRGGIRPGVEKFIATQPGGTAFVIQALAVVVTTQESPVQSSQSGRDVRLVAVHFGNVYYVAAGNSTWLSPTNLTGETPPLNATGLVQSSANNQLLFFADGTNWVYFNPLDNTLRVWTATSGTLPADGEGNLPRLICTWRGRIVLSGILLDPSLIVMSKVSDPFNYNYAPDLPIPPDAAWSGAVGPQGLMSDVVTALIPYSDDVLIVGMDSMIALFRGDPNYGGSIDLVTKAIGIAWGEAWCMDPYGTVYFFSNRTGVFAFVPGQQPQRISSSIDYLLLGIDTGAYGIRLQWNDRFQQLHLWVTLLAYPAPATHYVWEQRANAWWQDTFTDENMNPLASVTFDGNGPDDRVALIGSWDGYVRSISSDATTDDGEAIQSEVWIGPFLTKYNDSVMLHEVQGVLGMDSGDVAYSVYVAETAEQALDSTAVSTGTWSEGRNYTDAVRRAGYAAYVALTSSAAWAMENIRCTVYAQGDVRRKGK
jgi:hypothetical protein